MEDETANLAENMRMALMVCQEKFLGAEHKEDDALKVMESCLEVSVQHFSKTLPHIVRELKTSLGIESND
ncbi:unnamed protein product [Cuscuta epithymum]|uniref:Uncharacterized protein n=1 Tax=Cuscuta epithymum TaxID=186058 RepID=A0AAV0F9B4_9ASTE|nr:unnamed protein product [Cuscuta epithymum]CAH9132124.1 unnamed protein product [Cuscuta epithymum]